MVGIRKFCRHVQLRAAAIIFPADPFADPAHVRVELRLRVGAMALRNAVPFLPELLVLAREKRRNEIVLGAKVPVQARLGDPGSLDHKVDTDGAGALTIEQVGRRR